MLIIALCALLIAAGCGGSGGDSSSGSTEAGADAATETKQRVSSSKAPAAKKVEPADLVPQKAEPHIAPPSGPPPKKEVVIRDLEKGTGAVARTGDMLTVEFFAVYYETGKVVMSSWERGEPFTFRLGGGDGVLGWEKALQGMRVGGRRELIIPRQLTSRYAPPEEERSQIYVIDLRGIGQRASGSSR